MNSNEELILNWWTADTDLIPLKIYERIDHNARRRIDTRIAKGERSGNEYDEVDGVKYECQWRIRKKPKNE